MESQLNILKLEVALIRLMVAGIAHVLSLFKTASKEKGSLDG